MAKPTLGANSVASTATSDIKLPGAKKSKKGIVIAVIAAVLVIAGVGVWMWVRGSGVGEKRGKGEVTAELKKSFNGYINFLVTGDNSDEDIDLDTLLEDYFFTQPYAILAESIIGGVSDSTIDDNTNYLIELNNKYEQLEKAYYMAGFDDSLSTISDYFFEYGTRAIHDDNWLFGVYEENGADYARNLINSTMAIDTKNETLAELCENDKSALLIDLDILIVADNHGCLNSGEAIDSTCAASFSDELNQEIMDKYQTSLLNVFNLALQLRREAMATILQLDELVYDKTDAGSSEIGAATSKSYQVAAKDYHEE